MALRRIDSYPPQVPFSEIGVKYNAEAQRLGAGIEGENFAYGDDPYQEVALFEAANPNGTVLAFMHGGGWVNGYKEWVTFMAPALNAAGITFVAIGYRLGPTHKWPTGPRDVAAALKWINDNIASHGGDPTRVFIAGHSAGGHYATWMAVRDDWQAMVGLPAGFIRGALPISGVYDFTPGNGMPMHPQVLADDGSDDEDASPLFTIARTPPFFLTWADADLPALLPQAEKMAAALRDAGSDVTTLILEGTDHSGASYESGKADGQWLPAALAWMASH
ncbi:MAG: alpha/beta hydrolase [Proteobacteria bacterium]|nr:alpha/beta hydrolase [Pseudomonadota bacterium]